MPLGDRALAVKADAGPDLSSLWQRRISFFNAVSYYHICEANSLTAPE